MFLVGRGTDIADAAAKLKAAGALDRSFVAVRCLAVFLETMKDNEKI